MLNECIANIIASKALLTRKKTYCSKLLNKATHTISYVAKMIGIITSSLPVVKYGAAQ